MQKVDLAELRRLHAQGARSSHSLYVFDCIPALLDELEAAQEELRRLTQANGDLRKERDRAVAEAQRQDSVAKGLRRDVREVQNGAALQARDRRMKLIGAAEELEKAAAEEWQVASDGGNPILIVGRLQQRAAQLRREAESK